MQFFVHHDEWLRHMNSSHAKDWAQKIHMTTWFCDLDHTPPLEFNDEHAFREHLEARHEEVNKWQANALLRRKRGLGSRDQTICPLCECTPENIPNKMNPQDKLSILFSHIGNHLRSLAFFSLPSLDGDVANDTDASSSGANFMGGDSKEKDTSRGSDNRSGNDSAMKEMPLVFDEDGPKAHFPDSVLLSTEHPEDLVTFPQDPSFIEDQDVEWESYSGLRQEYDEDTVLDGIKRFQEQKQKEHQLIDIQGNMEQAISTEHGGEPNFLDSVGICLLSLDGGGVRGLPTLYILKSIMDRLNHQRKKSNLLSVKPCEVFDLIGGTSTGG